VKFTMTNADTETFQIKVEQGHIIERKHTKNSSILKTKAMWKTHNEALLHPSEAASLVPKVYFCYGRQAERGSQRARGYQDRETHFIYCGGDPVHDVHRLLRPR
jgi:hypothetical protein